MSFSSITNINIFAKNPQKCIDFYREVLGIEPHPNQDEKSSWYGFQTSGVELAIEPIENREKVARQLNVRRTDQALMQFRAESLDELQKMSQQLVDHGVELLCRAEKRRYGYCTNFFDPEGNFLELFFPKSDSIDKPS